MTKIDDQIKELQLKKKKIEFWNHILDSTKKYNDKDFKDVKDDVVKVLEEFVEDNIKCIETGEEINTKKSLTDDDIQIVKKVVETVKNRAKQPTQPIQQEQQPNLPPPQRPVQNANDKLAFALDNRHLANKRVSIANDQNMQVYGTVVGLDAPNVIVKTEAGPTIQVPIGNVSPA